MTPDARATALEALRRIDDGAYANLVLPALLERSGLSDRDRRFATELVYGSTRMRRACDHLIDRHLRGEAEPTVRRVLRLGAYQLYFMGVPPHAAVSATVDVAPRRAAGLVNAVLRRVAQGHEPGWPDLATELSYPDWVVDRLTSDLGEGDARLALDRMNEVPAVAERPDGYIQDRASQWVARYVGAEPGQRVADLCAAPGGKATALAAVSPEGGRPASVVALDIHPARAGLIRSNGARLGLANLATVAADARRAPFRPASFDRVLVDAPCSGLGVLRRRADARWRLDSGAPARLGGLQRELIDAAAELVVPGGRIFYSVCTVTEAETRAVDRWVAEALPGLSALPGPGAPWRPHGRGSLLLPQDADTDGMYLLGLRREPR